VEKVIGAKVVIEGLPKENKQTAPVATANSGLTVHYQKGIL